MAHHDYVLFHFNWKTAVELTSDMSDYLDFQFAPHIHFPGS